MATVSAPPAPRPARPNTKAVLNKVLSTLKNHLLKCMMEFVEYALGLFNTFNTYFQTDATQFGLLKQKIEELLKSLAFNFMKASYVRETNAFMINPHSTVNYVQLREVYSTLFELQDAEPLEVEKLQKTARDYIEAISQVKKRFQFPESDHFKDAEFLKPDNARNLFPRTLFQAGKKYMNGQPELKLNLAKLDVEWREQSIISNEKQDLQVK